MPIIKTDYLLEHGATYKEIALGEMVYAEGGAAKFYYQLVSGCLRWATFNEGGKEFLHRIIKPGESFGEFALIDDSPYVASVVADSDCVIIRLPRPAFLAILIKNPELHLRFTSLLAQRVRFQFRLAGALAHHSPTQILEYLISYYQETGEHFCVNCHQLLLTRQQLANMTGMRVETVIRTIKLMEKNDKLVVAKGKVFLTKSETNDDNNKT